MHFCGPPQAVILFKTAKMRFTFREAMSADELSELTMKTFALLRIT